MAAELLISISARTIESAAIRIVNPFDLTVWNGAVGELGDNVDFADSIIELTKDTNTLGFPIEIPVGLRSGTYYAMIYNTATPTVASVPIKAWKFNWDGQYLKRRELVE